MRTAILALALLVAACGGGGSHDAVSVRLDGNSVMYGSYINAAGVGARSPNAPGVRVREAFPDTVDFSLNGSTIAWLRNSADWPPKRCPSHHAVLHYHNDDPATFEFHMRALLAESCARVKLVVLANVANEPHYPRVAVNAATLRGMAGLTLCDAALGTAHNAPDFIHPDDEGYRLLSEKIIQCVRANP